MVLLQLTCAGIVILYLAMAARRVPSWWILLRQLLVLGAASWIAEDTCIRMYGFYA